MDRKDFFSKVHCVAFDVFIVSLVGAYLVWQVRTQCKNWCSLCFEYVDHVLGLFSFIDEDGCGSRVKSLRVVFDMATVRDDDWWQRAGVNPIEYSSVVRFTIVESELQAAF